jgi:D-glycero-D-manno-heptose 1,7-bisphosphate phosphatase
MGSDSMSSNPAALFLDRDGVLTEPIYNPATGAYESPHRLDDVVLCPDVIEPLRRAGQAGFLLFIVSNQPSYAMGKTSLEQLQQIARLVEERLYSAGVAFQDAYYCFHHPQGVVPDYAGACPCRKPQPYFLLQAAERHGLDLRRSWMIGDRDSDVDCGQRAGCRTVQVLHPRAGAEHQGASKPDFRAADLAAAIRFILREPSV